MVGRLFLCAVAAGALTLSACTTPVDPVPVPPDRPVTPVSPKPPETARPTTPSDDSRKLAAYYTQVETELVAQGLLRTDGGGPDTEFSRRMLIDNFERIAFFDEYVRGAGLRSGRGGASRLKRWGQPIRMSVEFGRTVPEAQQAIDRAEVARYAARLSRVTGHPITMTDRDPNYYVLYMSEDDGDRLPARVKEIVPNINRNALDIFRSLPRSIHCLVIAFSSEPGGHEYAKSIALIRAEHPSLLRKSCVHEELAQGLGLANDSPRARPSIFNDDDEFALLTSHDELLLKMLYDRRLRAGMSWDEAKPIVETIADEMLGGPS
ncbi:MAG: DUF2927 domain-containing protein [Marinovum algicola]|jgi:hypothetical protein|uniref:Lipoprotein n=1 Tax=Marinovum algicola TaxID=42444 RepID=A0A975ZQD4_9RHOB|nr:MULTISPECIES: DUF2927 domain-containing protein [Marinovum]AKO97796.1 hypothetical protein MALG_02638 [Marinovum algicola DG 898]MDD9741716.1 DUF2927 domain-containing protein [Marinovum sp. SP66]MDD9744806.1 DUF2927 domain-containing protein [Marinovum sp. PR37]SEK05012.1 Protein of unknown function [Marinovum algicola]SLN75182.1 hypothetical protein MAA5396_04409 [Marinovum algicola]